jgi:hypothetical protein
MDPSRQEDRETLKVFTANQQKIAGAILLEARIELHGKPLGSAPVCKYSSTNTQNEYVILFYDLCHVFGV